MSIIERVLRWLGLQRTSRRAYDQPMYGPPMTYGRPRQMGGFGRFVRGPSGRSIPFGRGLMGGRHMSPGRGSPMGGGRHAPSGNHGAMGDARRR